jgi:GAF domain-containing protein
MPLRKTKQDPEARALAALAEAVRALPARHTPEDALQIVADLARLQTNAKYSALAVTDEHDRTQGFLTSGMSADELRGLRTPPQAHGPLGTLRQDGRPVRLDNVSDHRSAFGFPPHHPSMQRLLGLPLWSHGNVRGSLYVTDRLDGKPFDHASKVIEEEWY